MDCEFKYNDVIKKANQDSTLKTLQSKRKTTPCVKESRQSDNKKMVSLSPSEYIQQISVNPENLVFNNKECRKVESTIFTPYPRIVVFQTFEIGNVYNINLNIRNTSKVPHHLKLLKSENVSFNVVFKGSTLNTRLAPGMTHLYDVEFHPDERRDYFHDVAFETDVGSFVVPVIGVGPRALLSFPDQIDTGQTAVKVAKTKPILMQNIGDGSTGFSILADNPCFTISPSKGSMYPSEAIQVQITFTPTKIGISNGHIFLRYESGDTVRSVLYGEAVKCDVRVLQENIAIESTYLGLSRIVSIEIQNNSDYRLAYEWVKHQSVEEDFEEREKCKQAIDPTKDLPPDDKIPPSAQELICQRIYSDKVQSLMNESFAYNNDHFQLFPMKAEVWPRNTTMISVTFLPKEVNNITSVAYLEIAGLENRIPVSLIGKCIGPTLELNLLSLDVQQVYLCSTYNYEVVCKNSGPIPGTLVYVQKNADFGSTITVEPSEMKVDIDELKCMKLSFCSDRTGHFVERVDIVIKESSELLSFVMKGTVICPLIRTDEEAINFHSASLGFPMKKQLCFRNLSHAPIDFSIKVPSDGYESAITHEEFARAQSKPKFLASPREFFVCPSEGTAKPRSSLRVQLLYTPNIVRSGDTLIQVDLCKSPNAESLLLPINCRAKAATFEIDPSEVSIRFCFVNFPYCRDLVITNTSDVEGYFYINSQEISCNTEVLYSLSTYQGYLKPGQLKEITLTIIVKTIGQQKISLSLLSLGLQTPVTCCEIVCNGQGPVISVEPSYLNWGEIRLLRTQCLTLELINDSPISAEFTASLSKNKSVWSVEPASGQLDANESMTLTVSVLLRDTGKYSDHLVIAIFNGKTIDVRLSVIGVGTSIVFNPEIFPEYDIGFLFRHQDIKFPITIRNEGTRHHYVLLTNVEKVRQTKKTLIEDIENAKFTIEPNVIELLPGSEHTLYCKIRWNVNEQLTEQWYVYATIDNQGKRELLGSSMFVATFVDPNIIFSKSELTFRLDLGHNREMLQHSDELEIINKSGLNLNAHFTIDSPFLMVDKCNCSTENIDTLLINDEPFTLKVCFPFDIENSELIPQKYDGYVKTEYDEHKQIDKILCSAQVNFPHLIFLSNEINLYCVSGYSEEERVKVINDGPLPVLYTIKWIKESFTYQSLTPVSESGSEELMIDNDLLDDTPSSNFFPKNIDDPSVFPVIKNYDDSSSCTELCTTDLCECAEEESEKSSLKEVLTPIDIIDKFLQITPEEGQILPYTEQYITFTFNGFENAKMSVQAVCEIERGSTQFLTVNATADNVRCEVQDDVLDYGLQLYCEPSITTLNIMNHCMIPLKWSIETSSNLLQVMEGPQIFNPSSDSLILIERRPSAPGIFSHKLFLEVTHLEPFVINVKWLATIPQIYLDIPRDSVFQTYPAEFGYQAVQLVMSESTIQEQNFAETNCSMSDITNEDLQFTEYEIMQLTDDDWQIIRKDERYPSQTDIDMGFERLIVKDFIQTNEDISITSDFNTNSQNLLLLAPAYDVNMNFVVIEQITQVSIPLRNYGYEKAKVKLKKDDKKRKIARSCFCVQIDKNVEICQCEKSSLNIIFSPKKDVFTQRRTDVSYKFYLEIKHGLTIPVNVKAAAVYPYVTVSAETLNFDKVFVGECREMSFLLKNNGLVNCQWEIFIENTSKNPTKPSENVFYIQYSNDVFIPGQEAIIKVYFKPYKTGSQKRNLIIIVSNSKESESIRLFGHGLERKLKINKTNIRFGPTISKSVIVEDDLIIENNNTYPIELYWQHLDKFSESNRIVRILKHYYRTDEILIPQRKIGENVPQTLLHFYNYLAYQMCSGDNFKKHIEHLAKDIIGDDYSQSEISDALSAPSIQNESVKKGKKGKSSTDLKKSKNKQQIEKSDYSRMTSALTNVDPNQVETLLHAYIDKLQKESNFLETMKDPLSHLYESADRESVVDDHLQKAPDTEKMLVIIFHGAPFTEYQETACRSAKCLNLPLLNLNQTFTEALALEESEPAKKLVRHLDERYIELTTKLKKLTTAGPSKKTVKNVFDKILQVMKKLPPQEELEKMDAYTSCEHKLDTVALILNIMESTDLLGTSKVKDKSSVKSKDETDGRPSTLPGIAQDLFREVLHERLSQSKFDRGYVLQTLNNDFVKNESAVLKTLLEATGKVKLYFFITFFNSYQLYVLRIQNINPVKDEEDQDKINKTINRFDEIADAEIDQPNITKSKPKLKKETKKAKGRLSNDIVTDNEPIESITDMTKEKEYNIPNFEIISKAMKDYQSNLNKLLETINEWESATLMESAKSINGKYKSTLSVESEIELGGQFFIWHVHAENPWDTKMYDATVSQISTNLNNFISSSFSEDALPTPIMQPRTYSILKEYETSSKSSLSNEIFFLSPQISEPIPDFSKNLNLLEKLKLSKAWSSTPVIFPLPDKEAVPQRNLDARWILQPRESRKFKLEFRPTEEGRFEGEFVLSLMDNAITSFKIRVEGISDIPRVDMSPDTVFDWIKTSKVSESHEPMYFLDTQVYDFGSLLVLNTNKRTHEKYTQFKFRNISAVSATVSLSLANKNYDCFNIQPRELQIKPNETEQIDVTAKASKLGSITDKLLLSIGNNNQPEVIQLECNGIELKVELEPKEMQLGRVLLHRTEKRTMMIRNKSAIAIYWRTSTDATDSTIRFTPAQGKIKYKGSCEIEFQYYADKIKLADTKYASFEVLLNEKDKEPIATDIIKVTAENYEILVDVNSENPINVGDVPVGSTNSRSFIIKNLGTYDIRYEIQFEDIEIFRKICDVSTLANLEQDFKIYPLEGLILPKKQTTINVRYTPTIETNLKSVPLLKCAIMEPYNSVGIVSECLLNISAISYYTRFSIEPHPKLIFGTLALKSTKTMQITIANTGKFPLKYSILNQSTSDLSQTGSTAKRRNSETVSKKENVNNTQNVSGKWGSFQLDKIMGELNPAEKDMITVRCCSNVVGRFEKNFSILVPDSLPSDEYKRQIVFVANICVAEIDLRNYNEILMESHHVESVEDFDCPNEFGDHTIFASTSKCLHFRRVCVGNSHTTSITLRNISAVYGDVIIEILDSASLANAFEVNTNRLSIPPMSKQSFTVTFAPSLLGSFSSSLNLKLDLPPNLDQQTFSIDLQGEGCVPQIRILQPIVQNNDNSVVNFGLSCVAYPRQKIFKVQNVGPVVAKLTAEILDNPNVAYSINLDQSKCRLSCGCSNDEIDPNQIALQILPEEIVAIQVQFVPTMPEKYEGRFRVLVDNNPYEIVEINLIGEGFTKSIILENLEMTDTSLLNAIPKTSSRESARKSRKNSLKHDVSLTRSSSKMLIPTMLTYKLDYGRCFLNRMSSINFKIKNKTTDRYFRFEWNSHPNIVFTPLAGHLAPNDFKELTATFLAPEPVSLSQVPLECVINEIVLNEPLVEPSWDSRQTNVSWWEKYPSSTEFENFDEEDIFVRKIVRETAEPDLQIIPETLQTIQTLVSVIANYSEYYCDIDVINFDDTLMFQSRDYKFRLKNIGLVNLDYSWDLTMDEQYPIRLDQANLKSALSLQSIIGVGERCNEYNLVIDANPTPSDRESKQKLQITSKDSEESYEPSDLFSRSAGLTDRSTDTWIEGENWPFEVTPKTGSLAPEEVVECTLKFAPVDVFEYKAYLLCKMENLSPNEAALCIIVTAKSLLPYCHFEIEDSDYLSSNRRDIKIPGPSGYSLTNSEIRNQIRVVEFRMMGIGECHTRYIHFVNPTTEDYCFCWSRLSHELAQNQLTFQCLPETGIAERGKRRKISFSTVPEDVGLFESFWQFEIKKYNLKTLFLIVANVSEPLISCRNNLIKLEPSAMGEYKTCSFEIINKEYCPLSFYIVPDSLYSEGRYQTISVCPMNEVLKPNSSQIFCVEYKSSLIGEYIFNIKCQIEKLKKPVKICITAKVIEILPKVLYVDTDGHEIEINKNCDNIIDIGQVMLCELMKLKFKIINKGPIAFDYSWDLSTIHENKFKIAISETDGRIEKNLHNICYLELIAVEKSVIRNHSVVIHVKYGPKYRLKLNASAKRPPLEFSFTCHDFGPCYIQTQDGNFYSVELTITNNQKIPCAVRCNFENNPHLKLDLHELPYAIPPNASVKIQIHFQPSEELLYQDVIQFSWGDSSIQREVIIKGEGIPYRIHLKNPCDTLLDFGTLTVGKSLSRKICVINEGRSPVSLRVTLIECSSEDRPGKTHLKCLDDTVSKSEKHHGKDYLDPLSFLPEYETASSSTKSSDLSDFIEISPPSTRDLKPRKELVVTVKFGAVRQVRSLKAKLGLEVDHSHFHLAMVKGNCNMASYYLNRTYISFGTIFEGCTAEEKLVLVNDGDIGTRFSWKTEKIKSHFDINPVSGYCSAGSEIIFTCVFKPSFQANCIESEAILVLEKQKNLTLNITGNCCPIPESTETIDFTAQVGQLQVKEIRIHNTSDQTWCLKPMIIGECFTATANVTVDPQETKLCNLTYKPLKKTVKNCLDKGKLIIILPDGKQPMLYNLLGRCSPAVVSEKFIRRIQAKKRIVETLVVYNNSDRRRTFDCKVEQINADYNISPTVDEIEFDANSQTKYKYSFLFETEGRYFYKVTFDDHGENYQCFDFEFIVTRPEIQSVIELTTYVRSAVFYNLKVENPLKYKTATFDTNNCNEDIVVRGLPVTVDPLAFKNVQIEYLPLLPCNKKTMLEISSERFGSTFYELHLTAKIAPPEKVINVKSILGSYLNFILRIKNYSKYQSVFDVTVDETALTCPKTISVSPNEESTIHMRFEPVSLENVSATVTVTSNTAGEFIFPIIGRCALPQPRGPFVVTSAAPTSLSFKNVFTEKKVFEISVDNPNFKVKSPVATIKSKEDYEILVRMKDDAESTNQSKTGKLTVTCTDQTLAEVKWIYYLKAVGTR